MTALDPATASRFAGLALDCVHRPYPNQVLHLLRDATDARPPRELTPAFYGCFDWHSAVHGHWLLARLARWFPAEPFAARAREALARSLTEDHLAAELAYLSAPGREPFERPYGLAWLVTLARELHQHPGPLAQRLEALEALAWGRLLSGFGALPRPVRSGLHGQTALSLGLCLDAARSTAERERLAQHAARFYRADHDAPLRWEPSGYDFLSASLAAADVLARTLPSDAFGRWLGAYLPAIPADGDPSWLLPEAVPDPSDGLLVHLAGLDLSRAWMLEGIARALPDGDPRVASLVACAHAHAEAGLGYVTDAHYAGAHWLGTFAVYLYHRREAAQR